MGGGDGPGKMDRVVTIEELKEKEKGIMARSSQQEDVVNKPETKVRFRIFWFMKSSSRVPIGGDHPGSHGCPINLKVMEGVKGEILVSKDDVSKG